MKKSVFFLCFLILTTLFCALIIINKDNRAYAEESFSPSYIIRYPGGQEEVGEFLGKLSPVRQKVIDSGLGARVRAMKLAYSAGYTKKQAISYSFPELTSAVLELEQKTKKDPVSAYMYSPSNSGKVYIEKEKKGVFLDKESLFDNIFYKLTNFFKKNYIFDAVFCEVEPEIKSKDLEQAKNLRASFKTSFASSSDERKNNIKLALESINSRQILPGECFSFNKTTGERNEASGYKKAKIIKSGAFVSEFGGGVCQVSTTLYNACLLADLEICEVHPHSLPVGYVSPCFDAMVNSGSSDLIFKNNTSLPLLISTKFCGDYCEVLIFGKKPEFRVERKSTTLETIENIEVETTTDYAKFGEEPLKKGEQKVVCYAKPGYRAKGELKYYKGGVLVKTKKIRENTYSAVKQVILVGK